MHLHFFRTLEAQRDPVWVGPASDHEISLKLLLVAVIQHVNPGVDVLIFHFGVHREVAPPLMGIVADEVVGLAGQLIDASNFRGRARADELHTYEGILDFRFWILHI